MFWRELSKSIFIILLSLITLPSLAFSKNFQIKMLNQFEGQSMVFEPAVIKINLGDEVTFTPTQTGHNSTSILTPKNTSSWQSETDKEFIFKFDQEGIYIYQCSNHAAMAMFGIIQVGNPINFEEAKNFLDDYRQKIIMNKDRVEKYLEKLIKNPNI